MLRLSCSKEDAQVGGIVGQQNTISEMYKPLDVIPIRKRVIITIKEYSTTSCRLICHNRKSILCNLSETSKLNTIYTFYN